MTMEPLGAAHFTPVALSTPLTMTVLSGVPARTEVTSSGKRVALLTHGARTVVLPARSGRSRRTSGPSWTTSNGPCHPALDEEDRVYWGTSPGGGKWVTSETFRTDYSVAPGTGIIDLATAGYTGTPACATTRSATSTCAARPGSTRSRRARPVRSR
ncbi:hypothetical protein ACIRP7_23125 [Streptomyces sp. NPDC102270]|uniref:hypothetical protein n=1 Tax=Streptomyces sp. NPDC102270 TaxID=3366150 RepID=UPI0038166D15